jgi:hypothetical protein
LAFLVRTPSKLVLILYLLKKIGPGSPIEFCVF